MTSVFSARGVSVSFGGVRAVAGVDLDIEPGELVGLIGPNGAGKTTFIDAVSGTAVLLVDHDMGLVLSVCDRVVVLDAGAIIAQGTPAQIRGDERVIAAYLGHASAGAA